MFKNFFQLSQNENVICRYKWYAEPVKEYNSRTGENKKLFEFSKNENFSEICKKMLTMFKNTWKLDKISIKWKKQKNKKMEKVHKFLKHPQKCKTPPEMFNFKYIQKSKKIKTFAEIKRCRKIRNFKKILKFLKIKDALELEIRSKMFIKLKNVT